VLGVGASDRDLSGVVLEGPELLRRFDAVSDGRLEQGRDQPVSVVLTLCAAAVLAGMRSFTAIAGWVADVPTELLVRLYTRPAVPPSKTTLWRVLTGADPAAVDAAVGAWLGWGYRWGVASGGAVRALPGLGSPDADAAGAFGRCRRVLGPALAFHITIGNLAQAEDGKWMTIAAGGRELMRDVQAIDKVTRTRFARNCTAISASPSTLG
jgi:DDE_Tnp_1-associated